MPNTYTKEDLVNLAVSAHRNEPSGKYSVKDSMTILRNALVEANGGSTKLDIKRVRDGECKGLFSIIETILQKTVIEGFQNDDFFNNLVEFKSTALGDENDFYIQDNSLFFVSEVARGTQGIRRQRFMDGEHIRIKTSPKVVKIYDEIDRVLSGRVDLNYFIDKVSASFKNAILTDAYNALSKMAETGSVYAPVAGSYSAEALQEIIAHVEASSNAPAIVIGTKIALSKIGVTETSNEAKSDLYNMGYYGKFYGTDTAYVRQVHKPGTDEFAFDDNTIYVIASNEKPIKVANEGEPFVYLGNPIEKADLSQEYTCIDHYGVGVVQTGKMGVYKMS